MPKYDTPLRLTQVVGTVGRAPEVKESSKGEFVSLSIAANLDYDSGPESTRWYSVAFNDPQVQGYVLQNIRKGMSIAVEGSLWEKDSNGRTYYNINGFRVGLVEWFVKGRTQERDTSEEDL